MFLIVTAAFFPSLKVNTTKQYFIMDTNNLSLSRCYDQPSARTSALDFLLALQVFLGQNQIEYVGPFRMRIEPTRNNNWALLVEGEANISSSDTPDQVSSGFPWPPTPPEYAPAHEIEMARPESNMTPSDVSVSIDPPVSM